MTMRAERSRMGYSHLGLGYATEVQKAFAGNAAGKEVGEGNQVKRHETEGEG
jgi:hypothetical protein